MITFNTRLQLTLLAFVIAAVTSLQLKADDTEVYLGDIDFSTDIRPNVLFIIDTSGSMDTDVQSDKPDYDATQTYDGACDASRIYWSGGNGGGGNGNNTPGCNNNDNWFLADHAINLCQDSWAPLSTGSGIYLGGKLASYNPGRCRRGRCNPDSWGNLETSNTTNVVECRADWGEHGDGTNNNFYPADGNNGGPFVGNDTNAINWNRTGESVTLYSGNYLNYINWISSGVFTKTRLETVQDVFKDLIDSTSGINAGLMRFDNKNQEYNKGGYFLYPMTQLNASTRAAFKATVDGLTPGGYTPLSETMYEAARFFRGEGVEYGNSTSPGTNTPAVMLSDRTTYKSPSEYQCQQNFVVLLTDGEPTYDYNADDLIKALPGLTNLAGTCNFNKGDDCLDELTHFLFEKDQRSDLDGDQVVSSFMIGFNSDQQLLQDAANKGGGENGNHYYTADNTLGLTNAFTQIISEILAVNTTFVAPAVPVNAFNRLTNRDELYFALFRPEKTPQWAGNIKRYKLGGSQQEIQDVNGTAAVDASTGFFSTLTTSFWTQGSDVPDGDDVTKGGAASRQALPRNLYTYTNAAAPDNVSLVTTANQFHESNTALTKTLLGNAGMTDAYRTELVQWARGVDVFDENGNGSTTDARHYMGDPLHSNPVVVNYGGTDANPDIVLFVATNEGMLHALNTRDGTEYFSFIPQELLPNLDVLYTNSGSANHPYGLDGSVTVWANDANNNGVLQDTGGTTETGEFAYLYTGMRRGGRNYYALDVTERSAPVFKWMIQGGQGDFLELAQTWSRPQVARIKSNDAPRTVLLFGGGYDTNQDTETAGVDSLGRAIYMVDANTGSRVWWAGGTNSGANLVLADMEYGFPATVVSGDINSDGYTDIIFAADVGGQLWRFDLDNSGINTVVTGGVIAQLAGSGTDEHRRFYEAPDVSLIKRNGHVNFAIGVGSGYRAHPLSDVTQDRYYMLFTGNVYSPPATYTVLTENDLLDVTTDLNPNLSSSSGWYISLEGGEKVMARSKTVDGLVLFTTFKPNTGNSDSCAPSQGLGRLYAVNVYDARPKHNLDGIGALTDPLTLEDRRYNLVRGGIQPEPTLVFTEDDRPVLIVGTEKVKDIELYNPIKRTSWEDQ
jgi:type IV pilus assembly protein PilY1